MLSLSLLLRRSFVLALCALLPSLAMAQAAKPDAKTEEKAAEPSAEKNQEAAKETFRQLALFADVFERVRADYVDPVTDEKLVEYAVNGMLSSLDAHSAFLNKRDFADMQTQTRGEFGGLGIEVTLHEGLIKIVSPIDETPAARAGLQPGDLITHIDEKPVMELTLPEAIDRMRGQPGTKIILTIRRGGLSSEPFDVTLTRAVIKIKSVRHKIEKDVGYVRITTFNEQTQTGLDAALKEIEQKLGDKLAGYVLDLRNNPGGLLDQAISVSGTFLTDGVEVVSTRGRHEQDAQSFKASGGDRAKSKPIVVLINGGSASASEIVAGALQDHRRGIVLGTKSFGKGSVQTVVPVSSSGAMRLTTARYYTPAGRSIQAEGIEPDIEVQPAKVEEIDFRMVREADLKGALHNERDTKGQRDEVNAESTEEEGAEAFEGKKESEGGSKSGDEGDGRGDAKDSDDGADKDGKKKDDAKAEPIDYQLSRAMDLLRGLALLSKPRDSDAAGKILGEPAAKGAPDTKAEDTKKPDEKKVDEKKPASPAVPPASGAPVKKEPPSRVTPVPKTP